MPRSERAKAIAEIRRLLRVGDRRKTIAARFRVYRRGDAPGVPVPAEILPTIYGGIYDTVDRRYVAPALEQDIAEIAVHEGQLPLVLFEERGVARCLALGPPGGGKTMAGVCLSLRKGLLNPNRVGGLIGATDQRRRIIWRKLLDVAQPLGWIDDISESKREIRLVNGFTYQVLAARKASKAQGNPLQGRDWIFAFIDESQNIDEDAQIEIDARGRNVGLDYCVYETATNAPIPEFRERLELYKSQPKTHRIIRYDKDANPWVDPQFYDRMRALMSEREYRERILVEEVTPEMLVYPRFKYADHVRRVPLNAQDITSLVVAEKYRREGCEWVVAQDFGQLVTTSIFLKAYRLPGVRDRVWFAHKEITSWNEASDLHARRILQEHDAESIIVVADPHFNTKESDKADYSLFQKEGIDIRAATHGKIAKKHRVSMMNALLRDADGVIRFGIVADEHGRASCKYLARSFMSLQYVNGDPEGMKKDYRDISHWTAAVGYGVYPWERVRGVGGLTVLPGGLNGSS
jgi:hypothetical protein